MCPSEPPRPPSRVGRGPQEEELVLAELVSRVLDRGVVVAGDVTISVAGIDLVYLGLRLHLTAVETAEERGDRLPPPGSPPRAASDGGGPGR